MLPTISADTLRVEYQKEDAEYVFNLLKAGESCFLIATGCSGKSTFLAHLVRDDVKKHYLYDQAPYYLITLLNPRQLLSDQGNPAWTGYELMLNQIRFALAIAIRDDHFPPEEASRIEELSDKVDERYLIATKPEPMLRQMAIRQLQWSLYEIFSFDEQFRVVFVIDELEEFFALLPPIFIQSLRGLRDDFKRRLMYVSASRFTRKELEECTHKQHGNDVRTYSRIEGFLELSTGFTGYLRPLNYDSAIFTLDRYFKRYGIELDNQAGDTLRINMYQVSGGHVGIMRRGFATAVNLVQENPRASYRLFLDVLIKNEGILEECRAIRTSLSPGERKVLGELVNQKVTSDEAALRNLIDKHIVNKDRRIAILLLHEHVLRYPDQ
jgi:hypothetical protein